MTPDPPDFDPNPSRPDLLDDIVARGRRYRVRHRVLVSVGGVLAAVILLTAVLVGSSGHSPRVVEQGGHRSTTTTLKEVAPQPGSIAPQGAPGTTVATAAVTPAASGPVVTQPRTAPTSIRGVPEIWFAVLHSPDGDITHVDRAGIWRVGSDGTHPQQVLADANAVDRGPVPSPDGTLVAFVSDRNTPNRSTSDFYQLYVMRPDGTGIRALTSFPPEPTNAATGAEGALGRPTWSPDGLRIAFNAQPFNNTESRLFVVNVDGSGLTDITTGANRFGYGPDWSPDGTKILFEGQNGLWTVSPDGTNRRLLAATAASSSTTRWSPDGRHIIESLAKGTCGSQVWELDADGTHLHQIVSDAADDYTPSFTRNGKFIAFVSDPDGLKTGGCGGPKPASIQVMDLDGGHRHTVQTPPIGSNDDDTFGG